MNLKYLLTRLKTGFPGMINSCAGILLPLMVVGFFSTNSYSQMSGEKVLDQIIGKVNDQIILKSELEEAYLQQASQRNQAQTPNKCNVLQNLLMNKVLLAKAEIDSVVVEEGRVEQNLNQRMQYFINQIGSRERIEEYYQKSIEEFKDELRGQVRDQLILQKMQQNITSDVTVTPSEVKKYFEQIPEDSLPFYSSEVAVAQIVRKPQAGKDLKEDTRQQLAEIRRKIVNDEASFAEMASEYSEDPGSASKGGNLGFHERGTMVPEYEATALNLDSGEISKPIESQYGFHIIQLLEKRGNQYNSRHILMRPSVGKIDLSGATRFLDSLRNKIMADSISFAQAAREYSQDQQTAGSGGFFRNEQGGQMVSTEDIDPEIFFTLDTMDIGDITKPLEFQTQNGEKAIRILYYKDRSRPHQASLEQDYQKLANSALEKKKDRILNEWFREASQEVFIDLDPQYQDCNIVF